MSADNWTICPVCVNRAQDGVAAAKSMYGKVSADEYEQARDSALKALHEARTNLTLRENYAIGIFNGTEELSIDYHASCDKCHFKMEFDQVIPIYAAAAERKK